MNNANAIAAIAFRDVTKLLRDRTRILANFVFPILFIGVLGASLQANLQEGLGYNFLTFVFTGVFAQTLFQSTASGIISLIEDRQNDFAQEMFVAPVSRYAIITGKIVGETLVSLVQVTGVVLFGLVIGVPLSLFALLKLLPAALLIAFFGGSFGVLVMSNLSEQRSANQIFPFLIFPQFFLAGVFNPITNLPLPLFIASRLAPMTYAIDLVRNVYYSGMAERELVTVMGFSTDLLVVLVLTAVFMAFGTWMFMRKERQR